jgi:hypothetical protein
MWGTNRSVEEGKTRRQLLSAKRALLGDPVLLPADDSVPVVQLDRKVHIKAEHGDARERADGNDHNKQNGIDDDSRGATNLLQCIFYLGVQTLSPYYSR